MTKALMTPRTLAIALGFGIIGLMAQNDLFAQTSRVPLRVERLLDQPTIRPDLHPSIRENIQGLSLIHVPDWVENRLGAYYLYFADHKGRYIRLAYADDLFGLWHIHPPGSLQIEDSHFLTEPPKVPAERVEQLRAALVDYVGLR